MGSLGNTVGGVDHRQALGSMPEFELIVHMVHRMASGVAEGSGRGVDWLWWVSLEILI